MFLSAVKVLEFCEIHIISAQKEPLLFILADPFTDNVFMTSSKTFNNSLSFTKLQTCQQSFKELLRY